MSSDVVIQVLGPSGSGKGLVIAAIAHALESLDVAVSVQAAETHNKIKLELCTDELKAKLAGRSVIIMELQTSTHHT